MARETLEPQPPPIKIRWSFKRVTAKAEPKITMLRRKINTVFLKPLPKKIDLAKLKFRFYRNNRAKEIKVRFTQSEYEKLTQNIQMPIAKYVRESALNNVIVRRIHPPKIDPKLLRQLAMLGNNLNQLTRLSHQKNNNNELELLAVANELLHIRQSLDDIKKAYSIKGEADAS